MNERDVDNGWLDAVLEQHLSRATAPDELWDGIATPRIVNGGEAARHLTWALALAMLLVAILWGFHLRGATPMTASIQMSAARRAAGSACHLCHVALAERMAPGEQTALN